LGKNLNASAFVVYSSTGVASVKQEHRKNCISIAELNLALIINLGKRFW